MADTDTTPLHAALMTSGGALYLGPDEHLRLRSIASASGVELHLTGRFLDEGQTRPNILSASHVANSDRTVKTTLIPMGVGWLLNAMVRIASGTPAAGQVYVLLEVIRGLSGGVTPLAVLMQGSLTANTPRAWPGSPFESSLDESAALRSVAGADPGAGAEISDTVPSGARWRLHSWRASLVADGTVANRTVTLIIDDGTTELFRQDASAAQTAGQTRAYQAYNTGVAADLVGSTFRLPMPFPVLLPAGARIRTSTANLQAGDNWGAAQILVEESLEL
jgi:hypothetical protein